MRTADTDDLAGWMRDVKARVQRLERRREIPQVRSTPRLLGVATVNDIPAEEDSSMGYYSSETGSVFVWRDGVLTDVDNEGVTITLEKFFQS